MPRPRGQVATALTAALLIAGAAACAQQPTRTVAHRPTDTVTHRPMGMAHHASLTLPADPAARAVALRTRLEELLGQSVLLNTDLVRAQLRNQPDLAQAADAALTRVTADVDAVLHQLYPDTPALQFRTLWTSHVKAMLDYALATASRDAASRSRSRAALMAYPDEFARFMSGVSGGALSLATLRTGIQQRVTLELQQVNAFAAGHYADAYTLQRQLYLHEVTLATRLAAEAARTHGAVPAAFNSPRRHLESAMGEMLGEHMGVAVQAGRAGVDGSPDFQGIAAELNANSTDLARAFGTLFGESAGRGFSALWARHIDAFVHYAGAVASHDTAAAKSARAALHAFEHDVAVFLSVATQGRLGEKALQQSFVMHDHELLQEVDVYAAKKYGQAYDIAYSGYQHMYEVAAALANAAGDAVAARLPSGGAQTGGGGTATSWR